MFSLYRSVFIASFRFFPRSMFMTSHSFLLLLSLVVFISCLVMASLIRDCTLFFCSLYRLPKTFFLTSLFSFLFCLLYDFLNLVAFLISLLSQAFSSFLVVFFFTEKNYLMSSLAMSVRPSVRLSVRLSVICGNIFGTRLQYN